MENFNVRIISKDIINGAPIATCVVTHNNLFLAAIKYNYFSKELKECDFIPTLCIPQEEMTLSRINKLLDQVKLSVLQRISSESHIAVKIMSNDINFKEY